MSFSSVADYNLTAIDTRPNETAPFQIARIFRPFASASGLHLGGRPREMFGLLKVDSCPARR